MKIGKYEVKFLPTGTFGLDGGAMFGIIPKVLWQKTNPPDEANRITLGTRCVLLSCNERKILIDTGIGNFWDEKFNKIYRIDKSQSDLENSLTQENLAPQDITDVILTHLHFDHTGGSTKFEDGKMVPAFPNAKYYVQKKHFDWALNPSDRDRGSFIADRFLPLHEEGVLQFIDGTSQFDDEIELIEINGHTFAQQMVKLSDESTTLLFCGDLIPTMSHIPIPYVMGYDIQPLITVQEKKKYLSMAVEEEWKLVFEHDPFVTAATVTKTDKGFKVKEKYEKL